MANKKRAQPKKGILVTPPDLPPESLAKLHKAKEQLRQNKYKVLSKLATVPKQRGTILER
jgi:hypothetical protein